MEVPSVRPSGLDDPDSITTMVKSIQKRMADYKVHCVKLQSSEPLSVADNNFDVKDDGNAEEGQESEDGGSGQEQNIATTPANISRSTTAASTPPDGHRAPPPTPASIAAAIETGSKNLQSIPEDGSMNLSAQPSPITTRFEQSDTTVKDQKSPTEAIVSSVSATISAFDAFTDKGGNQGLAASKFAGQTPRPIARGRPALLARDPNTESTRPQNSPHFKPSLEIKSGKAYQDLVVEQFRKDREDKIESRSMIFRRSMRGAASDQSVTKADKDATEVHQDAHLHDRKVTFDISDAKLACTANAIATKQGAVVKVESDVESDGAKSAEKAVQDNQVAADGQNRENVTYFSSWGAPEARSGAKSEVRRVIMTGLPFAIDNSLLASLIHRGALESYKIVKASESAMTASAVITFTTGSAAKSFYDKYPNGLVVKVNSKRSVASLELGENVDVVSGVMRGYLDSGATRVVRAIGADEDWGMGALRKAAEGKGRKLESIADFSRGESRTIEFRFTSIADAVVFRSALIRDIDWEDAFISFGEDPCAKATGPHKD